MAQTRTARLSRAILEDYIQSGLLGPGDLLPGIRELQRVYGASINTISHALGHLEARGIVEKRRGFGTVIKSVREHGGIACEAGSIGLVISPPSESELSARLYEGVDSAARRAGLSVLVASNSHSYEEEYKAVSRLAESGCSGLIVCPIPRTHEQFARDYLLDQFKHMPMVLTDLALPEHGRIQVQFDNRAAGYEMTCRLLREGHRRIAFSHLHLHGRKVLWRSVRDRHRGYIEAMGEAGLGPRPQDNWPMDLLHDAALRAATPDDAALLLLREWMSAPEHPTAVIAYSDLAAALITQAARCLGISMPDDLRIVGFDNMSLGRFVHPPFPTTIPDFCKAGELAVQLLTQQLQGAAQAGTVYMLPVPILWRDTTERAPAETPAASATVPLPGASELPE